MALFKVPKRAGRVQDGKIAQKSKSAAKVVSTVRGGSNFLSRIAEIKMMVEKNLGQYADEYIVIRDEKTLADYLQAAISNGVISIDTETTGLDPLQDKVVGVCIYTPGQKAAYVPINHLSYKTGVRVPDQLTEKQVATSMQLLIDDHIKDVIMFNAKFDIRVLRHMGLKDIYCTWDGYLAARLLNENEESSGLKALHKKYCLDGKGDAFAFESLFKGVRFDNVPIMTGYLYAAHDAVITYELWQYQKKYLRLDSEREDMRAIAWVFHNIEMPCVAVVADMEDTGVAFDMQYCQQLSEKYNKLLEEKKNKFYELCDMYKTEIEKYRNGYTTSKIPKYDMTGGPGYVGPDYWKGENPNAGKIIKHSNADKLSDPINISSPTQIAILIYDVLKEKVVDPNKPRGTGEEILQKIGTPICKAILEYREVNKLITTYIDKLPDCVNPKDGKVHCSFNQYGAKTGRFSSESPNLQNIPSHNKDIRKMFIASPGYVLMSSDYSQQEPKVMTQMCQDPKMIKAYQEGKDLYAEIAALSFNTTYDNCLEFRPDGTTNPEGKNRRSQAKSILLGVLYGRGVPSIAEQLGTSTKKAQTIKDAVFKGFPAIPKFEKDSLKMAEELGYVTTLWGRKRRLPDLQLPEYEFEWKDGVPRDDDPLDFDAMNDPVETEVPEDVQRYYLTKLAKAWGSQKRPIFEEAAEEGIKIIDNGGKIADASRQCVNARIQGSAADMSKLAMIKVGNDKKLKEWGFRLLIPVHDELIAECPEENAKKCADRFAQLMSEAAEDKLEIPIKCDVEITKAWYGEKVEL